MKVKNRMSKNPYCISKNTSISKALEIMSQYKFHRIPVVDDDNKLMGLLTEGTIAANTPSTATSFSMYELNYLISKTKTEDIMLKKVVTATPDMLLEEAALLMRNNDIGCLVVVDEDKHVEGIITQNDIFEAFIDVLGYYRNGTRYNIKVSNDVPGVLNKITKIFYDNNGNILDLTVFKTGEIVDIIVIAGEHDEKAVAEALKKEDFVYTIVKNQHTIM
jgi:acetoin utilization protein AcuB